MTTLADLKPLELANHVGTWVNVPHKPHPVIYMGEFESTGEIKHGARTFDPRYGDNYCRLDDCTLRPDLPRAWQADGTPPAGKWEHAERLSMGVTTVYLCGKENPTHRQWIGEWEEA
ncbi:hypothetical protein QP902_10000 [Corynebacterium marquesiae]|uniref:hypothetical protein n=1 Tax=Corynebacterium marquesiae TaxID=2913503 RepID=UPI00254AD9F5|nr:hypothetical protein [Corynebacterium marquesiae]MDK8669003.1 hypothetical protein [Corynebacterium marquesiae]